MFDAAVEGLVLGYIGMLTWMYQEVRINGSSMAYNLVTNGIYWGYNPLTNHLQTSDLDTW